MQFGKHSRATTSDLPGRASCETAPSPVGGAVISGFVPQPLVPSSAGWTALPWMLMCKQFRAAGGWTKRTGMGRSAGAG
jgi:hypothetical protein